MTALLVLLAMRISGSPGTRRGLAIILIVLGALCIALPIKDAARARDRFGGGENRDRYAHFLSVKLGLPEDVVREQLAEQFRRALRVEISPGVWLSVAGGVLLVAGGVLSLLWVRREGGSRHTLGSGGPG